MKFLRFYLPFIIGASLIQLFCSACNKSRSGTEVNIPIFHYNQPNFISSLDPIFAKSQNNIWAIDHLYNQLVDLDDSMQVKPELAESWEFSQDGKTIRFRIRKGILFHRDPCFGNNQTRALSARDVVFSFQRLVDPNLGSPGSWIFKDKLVPSLGFEALGDSIFIIHLKKGFSPLLKLLTMQYCSIVPEEAVLYYGSEFSRNPVGTGPFQLKKFLGRKGLFLKRNDFYFETKPVLEGIRISFIEDRNTAYLEFLKHQIDFFSGIQAGFAYQILDPDGQLRQDRIADFKMQKGNYLNTEYIGINLNALPKSHPLHVKKVRQALSCAIDRQKLVDLLRFGIGTPGEAGFIPKGLPAYSLFTDQQTQKYDPDKARKLLKETGYSNSNSFPALKLYTNKDYVDIMTFVAKQWQEIGIPVEIELVETSSLREQMSQGSLALFRASWIADYPDEESFLNVFLSTNPAPPNYTRFKNEAYDSIYEQAILQPDALRRTNMYHAMDQILMDELPVIVLFYDQTAWFSQNQIHGLRTNPLNLLKLQYVSKQL